MSLRFNPVIIADATTYAVKDYNSGLVHVIPDVASTITITLPTPKKGLSYTFIYGGAAADAQNAVITTGSDTNYYVGSVMHGNTTADAAVAAVYSDGNSNSKLTMVTPGGGTRVDVVSNGTLWYLNGRVVSATVPTLADQ
jgi:hypothetical protein